MSNAKTKQLYDAFVTVDLISVQSNDSYITCVRWGLPSLFVRPTNHKSLAISFKIVLK